MKVHDSGNAYLFPVWAASFRGRSPLCPAGARSSYSSGEKLRNRKRSRRPAVVTLSARLASFRPLERVVRGNLIRISGLWSREKKKKEEREKGELATYRPFTG